MQVSDLNKQGDSDYAVDAYRACMRGEADRQQQQSAAAQIVLLSGDKGALLVALERISGLSASQFMTQADMAAECVEIARAAIERATS